MPGDLRLCKPSIMLLYNFALILTTEWKHILSFGSTHSIGVMYFLQMGDWSISPYHIVWLNSYGMLIQKIRKKRLKRSIPLPSSQNKSNPPPSACGLDLFWLLEISMDCSTSHSLIHWIFPISLLQRIQNSNGMSNVL